MSDAALPPPTAAVPGQAGKVLTIWALSASGNFTDEKEPLLAKIAVSTEQTESDSAGSEAGRSRLSRCKWRNVAVAVCLWLAYTLCSVAYSTINPFFPQKVSMYSSHLIMICMISLFCSG